MKADTRSRATGSRSTSKSNTKGVIGFLGVDIHQVPLLQGICNSEEASLGTEDLRVIGERLQCLAEKCEHQDGYESEIEPRFNANLDFVRSMNKLTEIRDYVYLEIYITQQWRGLYRSLEHFVEAETGITRSSFHKAIDKAEIRLQLLKAGIEAFPKVRQCEQLAKVEKGHRVEAWKYVLTYLAREGTSESQTQFALLTYCIENEIAFGRTKVGKATTLFWFGRMDPKKIIEEHELKDATPKADWVESIPSDMDRMITDLMPIRLQAKFLATECGSNPSKLFLQALRDVVKYQSSRDAAFERRLRIIEQVGMNEPALADGLLRMAIDTIYNFAMGEMMLGLSDDCAMKRMAG